MHPKLSTGLGLIVTLIIMSLASAPSGVAAPAHTTKAEPCLDQGAFLPAVIDVPVNGTATFGIADLLRASPAAMECLEMAAIDASSFVAHAGEGSVAVIPGTAAPVTAWSATPAGESTQQFVFTARSGFQGVSQGWEFVVYGRDPSGEHLALGIVQTSFQVRNLVPVAANDAVTVVPGLGAFCVDAEDGLLANDVDANGDPMIVYSEGVTRFPWGTMELHRDGSYRVTVTDPAVMGSHQVSYLVWDQRDSTASADRGTLTLTFDDRLATPPATGHHRTLMSPDPGTGGCNPA